MAVSVTVTVPRLKLLVPPPSRAGVSANGAGRHGQHAGTIQADPTAAARHISVESAARLDRYKSDVEYAATVDVGRVAVNGGIGQDQRAAAAAIEDAAAVPESRVVANGSVDECGGASSTVAKSAASGNCKVINDGGVDQVDYAPVIVNSATGTDSGVVADEAIGDRQRCFVADRASRTIRIAVLDGHVRDGHGPRGDAENTKCRHAGVVRQQDGFYDRRLNYGETGAGAIQRHVCVNNQL